MSAIWSACSRTWATNPLQLPANRALGWLVSAPCAFLSFERLGKYWRRSHILLTHQCFTEQHQFRLDFSSARTRCIAVVGKLVRVGLHITRQLRGLYRDVLCVHRLIFIDQSIVLVDRHCQTLGFCVRMDYLPLHIQVCDCTQFWNESIENWVGIFRKRQRDENWRAWFVVSQKASPLRGNVVQRHFDLALQAAQCPNHIGLCSFVIAIKLKARLISTHPYRYKNSCNGSDCLNPCWPVKRRRVSEQGRSRKAGSRKYANRIERAKALKVGGCRSHEEIVA